MDKVYLAKSNRSNPDTVSRVRAMLSKYDVEVVEFTGGRYTHKPLLACDYLIIVPDLSEAEDYDIPFGKGLVEQYEAFKNQNYTCYKANSAVINVDNRHSMTVAPIDEIECADPDDYVNYGYAILDGSEEMNFEQYLEEKLGYPVGDSTTTSSRLSKYLLIGSK